MSGPRTRCDLCNAKLPRYAATGRPRKRCAACARDKSALGRAWRAAHPDAVDAYNASRRLQLRSKRCRDCRLSFRPRRTDQLYCSAACRQRRARRRSRRGGLA